ncbi:hypothetical protein [Actinoplanes sp. DH11]|uniref:hypothetical protein n=1 Tax=Actinoplanes sp. DH11 TaxID=2857011 RepID=UPI001E3C86B2|nr:hypothetical protein [Actinoplanes sp. DH11]
MRERVLAGVLVAGLTLAAAGCASPPPDTITAAAATEIIEGHLAEAIAATPDGITLSPKRKESVPGTACTEDLDSVTGQVVTVVVHESNEVTSDVASRFIDTVAALWEPQWESTKHTAVGLGVNASFTQDGTGFRLEASYLPQARVVQVSGITDCLWAEGTPGADHRP